MKRKRNMSTCLYVKHLKIQRETKVESRNELTHRANRNCAWPSFEEEEQKRTLVEGRQAERIVLGHAREGGGGWT